MPDTQPVLDKKPRKASQNSRNCANGKTMELKCSKLWSKWTGVDFRRRKVEGHDKNTVSLDGVGDVICADPLTSCKFTIECKNRRDFSFSNTPFSIKSPFWDWFAQSACDANIKEHYSNIEYFPFLHFRNGNFCNMVAMYKKDYERLTIIGKMSGYEIISNFPEKIIRKAKVSSKLVDYYFSTDEIIISTWDSFSNSIDPKSVFY